MSVNFSYVFQKSIYSLIVGPEFSICLLPVIQAHWFCCWNIFFKNFHLLDLSINETGMLKALTAMMNMLIFAVYYFL